MKYSISFFGYDLTKDDTATIKKISKFLEKESGKNIDEPNITDVLRYDDEINIDDSKTDINIIFGAKTKRLCLGESDLQLPDIKTISKEGTPEKRKEAFEKLSEYAKEVSKMEDKKEEIPQESFVEHKGITFGECKDISVSKEEAEHLNKIKNILGGGKIIIRKGDIELEVE